MKSKVKKLNETQKKQLDKKSEECAIRFRKKFNLGDEPINNIFSLDFTKEFLLLKFPNEMKISGAYIEKKGRNNIYKCIYINTNEPKGRQSFSFAHELYHAFFEKSKNVLSQDSACKYDPIEYCAERFASYLLIPRDHLKCILREIKGNRVDYNIENKDIFKLQEIYNVSFMCMVYVISDLDEKSLIPKNIKSFMKYRWPKYWGELEKLTLNYNKSNYLNSVDATFEWPKEFKENIEKNLSEGLVSQEDVEDIYDFFEFNN